MPLAVPHASGFAKATNPSIIFFMVSISSGLEGGRLGAGRGFRLSVGSP